MSNASNNKKNLRCAIYARWATGDAESIERQVQICRDYIAKQTNSILSEIYIDGPTSGNSADRPHLRAILEATQMKPRHFDCLVISETSRLGRDLGGVVRDS